MRYFLGASGYEIEMRNNQVHSVISKFILSQQVSYFRPKLGTSLGFFIEFGRVIWQCVIL